MASIRATNKTITKRLTKLENKVKSKLTKFYKNKIKPNANLPIDDIRRIYEKEVKALIRVTVQEAYLTGTDIVGEKITEKDPNFQVFISQTDVQNIATITDKLNDRFWTTAGKLVRREQEFILNNVTKELEKKKSYDDVAAMIMLAVFFAYFPFNSAVISKLGVTAPLAKSTKLLPNLKTPQLGQTPIQALPNLTSNLIKKPISVSPKITQIQQTQIPVSVDVSYDVFRLQPGDLQGKIMFLTKEDAKVDPDICEPLNRTIYDINDPDIPVPIEDTHDHCRCRLVPLVDDFMPT